MSYNGQKNSAYGVAGLDLNALISTAVLPAGINANLIGDGSVSNTEFQYLDGASSNIQAQLNNLESGYVSFDAKGAFTPSSSEIAGNLTPATSADTDGETLTSGQTVFVYSGFSSGGFSVTAQECGVYIFNGYDSALTRASSMNSWDEVVGSRVYVNNGGTAYAGTIWTNSNQAGGTLNTTPITYISSNTMYVGDAVAGTVIDGNIITLTQSITADATPTFAGLTVNTTTPIISLTNATYAASFQASGAGLAANVTVGFSGVSSSNTVIPEASATSGNVVQFIDGTGAQNLVTIDLPRAIKTTSAYYTMLATDSLVIVTAAGQVITLPSAATVIAGVPYSVKSTFASGVATSVATSSSQTIDGASTAIVSANYNALSFVSDGSNWFIV